jgi:hypothetical protein
MEDLTELEANEKLMARILARSSLVRIGCETSRRM